MAITTRDATLFADRFPQVVLDVFEQEEALQFIRDRCAAVGRTVVAKNAAALVAEVGLVPQQLDLAAAYLEVNILVTTVEYVAALRALKQDPDAQQLGGVVLPEANLGLRKVGYRARKLMLHIAHLEPDFSPVSLVASLLGEPNQ